MVLNHYVIGSNPIQRFCYKNMPQFDFLEFITYCDVVDKLQLCAQNDSISNLDGMIYFHNYLKYFCVSLFLFSIILLAIHKNIHKNILFKKILFKYFFLTIPVLLFFLILLFIQPIKTLIALFVTSFFLSVTFFFILLFLARLNQTFGKRTNKFTTVCQIVMVKFNIDPKLMLSSFLAFSDVHKIKLAQNGIVVFFTLRFFETVLRWKCAIGMLTLVQFQYIQMNIISLSWIALSFAMWQFFYHYNFYFSKILVTASGNTCLTINYLYSYSKYLKFWYLIAFIYATLNGFSTIILDLDMHDWMIQLYQNKNGYSVFIDCLYLNLSRVGLFLSNKFSFLFSLVTFISVFLIMPYGVKNYSRNNVWITKRTVKVKVLLDSAIKAAEGRAIGKTWIQSSLIGYNHYLSESSISRQKIIVEQNVHGSSDGHAGQKDHSEQNHSGASSTFIGLGLTAGVLYTGTQFLDSALNLKDRIFGEGEFTPKKSKAELLLEEREKREQVKEISRLIDEEENNKKSSKNKYLQYAKEAGKQESIAQRNMREEMIRKIIKEKLKED